jgi:hypothetical protein
MVRCGVLFKVRTEVLNIIWKSFSFEGLMISYMAGHFSFTADDTVLQSS